MRCAVIDTNVLMYSYLERVDIFSQLKEMGFKKFYVPSKVVDELNRLKVSLTGKERQASKFALSLIDRYCEIVEVEATGTDLALIELARSRNCVLITNDKKLKKMAKDLGIPIGYLRELKRIEIEDFYEE
ncbi:type II toxin-antitoxin system VapC family toxin [Archaeoglobus sp.]